MESAPDKRILIVAKEPDHYQETQRILHGAGYRIYSASEGGEAIELIYSEPPDLILMERNPR